jgi:RHS repeat-associated protein
MKHGLDGRRVQLRTTTGSSYSETNYLWDTTTRYGDVLVEIEKNGNIQARYVYGNACGSCSANPVAELISQKRGAITNPREYYLLDGQGSVSALTDGATGTLTYSYDYDTFGKLTSGDATKSTYLYTGQQYDAATELYSLRARYYSPQQGRFLSQDKWPVDYKNPMELNRYGYTANNPVNFYDPSGYAEIEYGQIIKKAALWAAASAAIVYATPSLIFTLIISLSLMMGAKNCYKGAYFAQCSYIYSVEDTGTIGTQLSNLAFMMGSDMWPTGLAYWVISVFTPPMAGVTLVLSQVAGKLKSMGEDFKSYSREGKRGQLTIYFMGQGLFDYGSV